MSCDSGCCGNSTPLPSDSTSGSYAAGDEFPVKLTEAAVEAIKVAIKEEGQPGDSLRISVVGGGCSGLQYNLDFEKETRMGDISQDFSGVSIIIDSVSANYLKGTTIDYLSGLNGTGFKFNNPNAKRTCGCGSSFS